MARKATIKKPIDVKTRFIPFIRKLFLSIGFLQENIKTFEVASDTLHLSITTELGRYTLSFSFVSSMDKRTEVRVYLNRTGRFASLLSIQYSDEFKLEPIFEGLKKEAEEKMNEALSTYVFTTIELEWLRNQAQQILEITKSSNKITESEKEKTLNG